MSGAIRDWLAGIGLEQYASAFEDNDIDADLIAELGDSDLRELGVVSLGHRKRLLRSIEALKPSGPPAEAAPAPALASDPKSDALVMAPAAPASGSTPRSSQAERRQLTVMFCDLADSTRLSTELDPEDYRELIRGYQQACAAIVARQGGFLARYLGDGLLAYFGWPQSNEDDAERAVNAGLGIVAAVRGLPRKDGARPLAVRVGIATGPVVVGDIIGEGAAEEAAVTGVTPNLAARLQQIAAPDSVVIAPATRLLLGDLFVYQSLGPRELKGIGQAIEPFLVTAARPIGSRFEATRGQQLRPLVGRSHELALLEERWESARQGEGQAVLLSGEGGIGKSRLVQALIEHVGGTPHFRIRFQCSPNDASSAFSPAIRQLERRLDFQPGEDADVRLGKIEQLLGQWGAGDRESVALVAGLLMLPFEDHHRGPLPQQTKQRLLDLLSSQVFGLARQRPVLFVLEDAHWIDPSTLELTEYIVSRLAGAPVLVLVTHRPDWRASFLEQAYVTSIQLSRLGHRHVAELIRQVTAAELPDGVVADIIERSDGIPLFAEEMTRATVESRPANASADGKGVPETLQASLMARLDRLPGPARDLAQIAAVIGREVSLALLDRVAEPNGGNVDAALEELLRAQLMQQAGSSADRRVQFRHALIRDAAYQSLLVSRRRELHRRVAEALAEAFPDTAQSQPELIARHYADAGDPDSAVAYWCRAGARAVELVANREAVTHYDNALAQLALTPPGRERDQRELRITLALGLPLIAATGYASQRVREAYSRARALSEELDDASSLFTATRGLWNCVFDRAELDAALELAQNLVRLAPATDRVRQSLSLRALGSSYMNRGALDDSVAAFDGCLAIPEGELSASSIGDYGEAPHSISLQYKGYIRCVQGRPAEGLDLVGQAVARTRALRHPLSLAFALFMQSLAQLAVRDYPAARATAEDTLRTAREHFLVFWTAGGKIALGCATAHLEGAETGLALAREGLEDWRATGARLGIPIFLSLIADAALAVGRPDLARATVAEALDVAAATGEYLSLADLQRLDGEVARRAGDAATARRHFEAALETAERQGALLFALGGALGLARLFADDGRQEAARDALRAIVARFGPDTRLADLEAAQTLQC